jgi:hypothetical protein
MLVRLHRFSVRHPGAIPKAIFAALASFVVALVAVDLVEIGAPGTVPFARPAGTGSPFAPSVGDPAAVPLPQAPAAMPEGAPSPGLAGGRMTFAVDADDPSLARASGDIAVGTAAAFDRFLLGRGRDVTRLALDSRGGAVAEALAIGRAVREAELSTEMAGGAVCASACPLILAGGVERVVATDAWVGVHQIYRTPDRYDSANAVLGGAQSLLGAVHAYLEEMGVDSAMLGPALQTPPERLHYFDADALLELGLATAILD